MNKWWVYLELNIWFVHNYLGPPFKHTFVKRIWQLSVAIDLFYSLICYGDTAV